MPYFSIRHDRNPLSTRLLVRQILAYAPAAFLPAIIGVLSSSIFTRFFTPDAYGSYSLTISITTFATALAIQWARQSLNRYLPSAKSANDKAQVKQVAVVALFLAELLVAITAVIVITKVSDYGLAIPGALLVALGVFHAPLRAVFRSEMQGVRYTLFHVLESVLKFSFSLVFVLIIGPQPSLLVWGAVLSLAVLGPFAWHYAGMSSAIQHAVKVNAPLLRRFAAYGLPMAGWYVAETLLNVGDRYVIQWMLGSGDVGIYSANYQLISGAIGLVTAPVLLAAHPFLIRSWSEGDHQETARWLGAIVELLSILGVFFVATTTLLSADIARWFLGSAFRDGHVVMPIVLAGAVLWNISMYLHKPLEFKERTTVMLVLGLAAAVLNTVLNIVFVPRYGYVAAAWTTLVSYASYGTAATVVTLRSVPMLQWSVRLPLLRQTALWSGGMVLVGLCMGDLLAAHLGYWAGAAARIAMGIVYGAGVLRQLWMPVIQPLVRSNIGHEAQTE